MSRKLREHKWWSTWQKSTNVTFWKHERWMVTGEWWGRREERGRWEVSDSVVSVTEGNLHSNIALIDKNPDMSFWKYEGWGLNYEGERTMVRGDYWWVHAWWRMRYEGWGVRMKEWVMYSRVREKGGMVSPKDITLSSKIIYKFLCDHPFKAAIKYTVYTVYQ